MPKKITLFELDDSEKEYFKRNLKGFSCAYVDGPFTPECLPKVADSDALVVFIQSNITKEIVANFKKTKFIATMSTGFDHIDVASCRDAGIVVSNVPFYGENTVAEHAFGLILSLSRKIYLAADRTKKGNFSREGLRGFDLKGKTIGLVGMGHIGMNMARMAKGFGMDVIAFDVRQDQNLASAIGFSYVETLDELLKNSNIISLHAPYNKNTHHLINRDNIKMIKKGALLINTARGGLVETEALVKALDAGIISGAGLDVLEGEDIIKEEKQLLYQSSADADRLKTLMGNNILLKRENVIITPHTAFNSTEALERILETTIKNLKAYFDGNPINTIITK